jgi:membrane associated rhomboid family serine protease
LIPLRDIIPSRTTPLVTIALIAVNVLVFLFELSLGRAGRCVHALLGPRACSVLVGAVFTSMFLHGGCCTSREHAVPLDLRRQRRRPDGHGRFLVFYLLCGIAAALAQTITAPDSVVPMVGASGAIAGVMGAYFVLYPKSRIVTTRPAVFLLSGDRGAGNLCFWHLVPDAVRQRARVNRDGTGQSGGGVAFWAHVAGFVAGISGVVVFRRPERQRVEWWHDV